MAKPTDQEARKPQRQGASEQPAAEKAAAKRSTRAKKPASKKGRTSAKTAKTSKKLPAKAVKATGKKTKQRVTKPTADAPPGKKKSKRKRKSHATRPTAQEEIEILERQELVYELRKTGVSFRKIAKHLSDKGVKNASTTTVHRDFTEYLDKKREAIAIGVSDMVDMAVENLEELQMAILPRARKYGKKDDILAYIALDKRRDEYLSLSKAQQSENNVRSNLAKLLGIAPEDLPDVDDADELPVAAPAAKPVTSKKSPAAKPS